MSGITLNVNRIGNFTSSENYKLIKLATDKKSFGKPALTYIQEKIWERKLNRSISVEANTRPMLWGSFLETRVHNLLGMEYEHVNNETVVHPKYPFWAGSPDFKIVKEKVVSDSKCLQPKKFCELVDDLTKALETGDISYYKDNHEEHYWQLVSNACILGYNYIEPILYLPYESELTEIRMAAENFDGEDQYKYRFIWECNRQELAYQSDDSKYKNLYKFRFPLHIPDAILLEQNIIKAGKLLDAIN